MAAETERVSAADPLQDSQGGTLRHRSLRGGVLTMGSQFVKFVLQIVSTAVLARLLTPSDYGLFTMVAALVGFANLLKDLGLSTATVQKETISQAEVSALFWINVLAGVVVTLVLALCAPLVVAYYGRPELLWLTRAYGATAIISSLAAQHSALWQRQMKFGAIAQRDLLSTAIGMIAGIVAAAAGLRFWALVVQLAAASAASTAFLWWRSGWRPGPPRRTAGLGHFLRFGWSMTLSNLLAYANNNMDNVLLGRYAGDVAVGLYSRAQGLLNKALQQVLPPILNVALPMFSKLTLEPLRFKKASLELVKVASFAGCALVMIAIPTADWIVRLLLGAQWAQVTGIFRILAVFGLLEPLAYLLGSMLVASGKPGAMAGWRAGTAAVALLSFIVGVRWGVLGIAVAYAASGIATRTWLIFFVGRRVGVSGWEFLGACGPFVLLAGAISAGLFLLRAAWGPPGALAGLSIFVPLGAAAYIGVMLCVPAGRRFLLSIRRLVSDAFRSTRGL